MFTTNAPSKIAGHTRCPRSRNAARAIPAGVRYIVSHDTRVGISVGQRNLLPMSRDHPCAGSRRANLMPVLLRSASQDIRAAAGALHEGLHADTLLHRLRNAWRA